METFNSNRETILRSIRSNLPKVEVGHPGIRAFQAPAGSLKESLTMWEAWRRPNPN
jgi:hypothetical protein